MKKFFYSFGILAMFGMYALQQQSEKDMPAILPPAALPAQPSNTASDNRQTPAAGNSPSQTVPSGSTGTPTKVSAPPSAAVQAGQYKDGQYTGPIADAYYGNIQVRVVISGGKINDVAFLQYPDYNSTCQYINSQAMPYLRQEAIQAQSANVQVVSGATDSSMAFQQSLAGALSQAKL